MKLDEIRTHNLSGHPILYHHPITVKCVTLYHLLRYEDFGVKLVLFTHYFHTSFWRKQMWWYITIMHVSDFYICKWVQKNDPLAIKMNCRVGKFSTKYLSLLFVETWDLHFCGSNYRKSLKEKKSPKEAVSIPRKSGDSRHFKLASLLPVTLFPSCKSRKIRVYPRELHLGGE